MPELRLRKRWRGKSITSTTCTPTCNSQIEKVCRTGTLTMEMDTDQNKIHPSPSYFITRVDRLCHSLIALSIAIMVLDRMTFVSSSPAPNVSTYEYEVSQAGYAYTRENVKQANSNFNFGHRPTPAESNLRDLSVTIPSFLKRNQETPVGIFMSPPAEGIEMDDEINDIESLHLHSTFDDLYKEFSEEQDADINMKKYKWKDEPDMGSMGGHVHTEEDYEDDFLVNAHDYLLEFFAFDDDLVKEGRSDCRQTSFHRNHNPTCNKLHEVTIFDNEYDGRYLARGSYRTAFSIYDGKIVLKVAAYELDYDIDLMEMIRFDALIMELLTASNRIVTMYSHCGLSVHVDFIHGPDIEESILHEVRDEMVDPPPPPELSPSEKLQMALDMAEALSDLHGNKGGPIVHNDIQYSQFLLDENKRAILSDFNRAEPMTWSESKNGWCDYEMGGANGNLRSPEEYSDEWLNEKIDVYSYGNVLYSILTGLDPYYGEGVETVEEAKKLCAEGIVPHVGLDIRGNSFAEAAMAAVMDKTFAFDSQSRIDIFTATELLRDAKSLNDKLEAIKVTVPTTTIRDVYNNNHIDDEQHLEDEADESDGDNWGGTFTYHDHDDHLDMDGGGGDDEDEDWEGTDHDHDHDHDLFDSEEDEADESGDEEWGDTFTYYDHDDHSDVDQDL